MTTWSIWKETNDLSDVRTEHVHPGKGGSGDLPPVRSLAAVKRKEGKCSYMY